MLNNRGQIAGTITWVVATIIVIVVLIISISVVSLNLKYKKYITRGYSDLLVTKSLTGYLLSDDGNGQIFWQIKDKKGYPINSGASLEKSNIDLAKFIFPVLYSQGNLANFWLGIVDDSCKFNLACQAFNTPFGRRGDVVDMTGKKLFYNSVQINDKSFIELLIKLK